MILRRNGAINYQDDSGNVSNNAEVENTAGIIETGNSIKLFEDGNENRTLYLIKEITFEDSFTKENKDLFIPRKESTATITRDSTQSNLNSSFRARPSPSRQIRAGILNSGIDWYGNTYLHNLFAHPDTNVSVIEKAIQEHPTLVSATNQFGRLPLHYALDRGKVNVKGLEVLLHFYPQGVQVRDQEGDTPYDIALRWDHSKSILLLLLNACPELDRKRYLKLKYGPIGSLAHWATASFRNSKTFSDIEETSSYHEESLLEDTVTCATSKNDISRSNALIENTVFAPTLQRMLSRKHSID